MKAERLPIRGAAILRCEVHADERGAFRRIVDIAQLAAFGAESAVAQVSSVTNHRRGTLRGLHYQIEPHGEAKTLWCTSGAVFDVIVDLRIEEPTYGQWISIELDADDPVALHVPRGVAHGYQTLVDNSALTYMISSPYVAESARVLHWRDPTVGINWPLPVTSISERDSKASPWPPQH